jgi:hypothetical protein
MIYNNHVAPFEWKDLHGKIVKIAVADPNPECLEFTGQVWAKDLETGKIYLIKEFRVDGK